MLTAIRSIAGALCRSRSRRRPRVPWGPLLILGSLLICAAFAPVLSPSDPTALDLLEAGIPPGVMAGHPLGTDVLGRDVLSRLLYGARSTLSIALVALGSGAVVGTFLGLVSGYWRGRADAVIMRMVDAVMGFPTVLVAMMLLVVLGAGVINVIVAVAFTVWASFARMIRGQVLSVREQDFVLLAKIAGVPPLAIVWRHVLPNTVNLLLVLASLRVGQVILLEASLSFLGLGLPPGAPAWGIMVAEGRLVIVDVWWLALFPGLAITLVVLAFNFLGDWLRDHLDPRLRRL